MTDKTKTCPTCGSDDKDYSPDGDSYAACYCADPWHSEPALGTCEPSDSHHGLYPHKQRDSCINWHEVAQPESGTQERAQHSSIEVNGLIEQIDYQYRHLDMNAAYQEMAKTVRRFIGETR